MTSLILLLSLSAAAQTAPQTVCPSLDFHALQLKSRVFSRSFSVKQGGREIARLESKRHALRLKVGRTVLFSARISNGPGKGHTAMVSDCVGRAVGEVEEVEATADQAIGYTFYDAAGQKEGWSGRLEDGDRLRLDRSIDGRLGLVAAALWERAQMRHAEARNSFAPPPQACGPPGALPSGYERPPYLGGCQANQP